MYAASTIAAIATGRTPGAIGIVRLSGPDALKVAQAVFSPYKGPSPTGQKSHTLSYGHVLDPNGGTVDQCLCAVMRGPNSYTGEDTAEFYCHGGLYLLETVLRLCLENGAAPAEPGEFSKRAFLNGKLDLSRAEAIIDIIAARSGEAGANAAAQLSGAMHRRIMDIRARLVRLNADIMVGVEYPDEDIEETAAHSALKTISNISTQVDKLYKSFETGRAITDGIDCAIIGRPNVGKSSLLNALTGFDRAIVTDIAGTTRDVVSETVRTGGVILNLRDTAGIRNSADEIERAGIERSREAAKSSELILCVFDASAPLTPDDEEIIELGRAGRSIAVLNKCDKEKKIDKPYISSSFKHIVEISAKNGDGMGALTAAIEELFLMSRDFSSGEIVTSRRQRHCLLAASEGIARAIEGLRLGFTPDIVTVDLNDAIDALGAITGERADQSVIDDIFGRFCLGK